jgi:hypothetical protein
MDRQVKTADKPRFVQLEGEELEHARKLVRSAEDHLRQIAKLVSSKVHPGQERGRVKQARFVFDNLRVVIDDEDGCEVFEDPPGVCRPCKPGE